MVGQTYYQEGLWRFDNICKNIWKIFPHPINYIAMAAGYTDQTTELHIKFPHRWISTNFRHTNNADVNSTNALTIIIRRPANKNIPAGFEEDLYNEINIKASKITELWGEKFEREQGTYDLIFNTANTERVYPVFYVQNLGGTQV